MLTESNAPAPQTLFPMLLLFAAACPLSAPNAMADSALREPNLVRNRFRVDASGRSSAVHARMAIAPNAALLPAGDIQSSRRTAGAPRHFVVKGSVVPPLLRPPRLYPRLFERLPGGAESFEIVAARNLRGVEHQPFAVQQLL